MNKLNGSAGGLNPIRSRRQLAALKRDLVTGIDQLDNGRYQTCDDANVMQLAEDVGRAGRTRLKKHGT